MLILNGKKFAKNEDEFTSSLFETGGTCVGYYKANKKSITLKNMQKEKIGVINQYGCLLHASKQEKGYWYSFMDIPEIGEYKNIVDQYDETGKALKENNIQKKY